MRYTLEVERDDDPISPCDDDGLYGHILCFHKRYDLGHKHPDIKSSDFKGWGELETWLRKERKAVIVLPVYMYDHSGITISTSHEYPYNDQWDAGQVGLIYLTKNDDGVPKNITKKVRERLEKTLVSSIKIYDTYLRGDIYRYTILDTNDQPTDHGCCGFYSERDAAIAGAEDLMHLVKEKACE